MSDLSGGVQTEDKEIKICSRDKLGSWTLKTECDKVGGILHLGCFSFPRPYWKEILIPQREHC